MRGSLSSIPRYYRPSRCRFGHARSMAVHVHGHWSQCLIVDCGWAEGGRSEGSRATDIDIVGLRKLSLFAKLLQRIYYIIRSSIGPNFEKSAFCTKVFEFKFEFIRIQFELILNEGISSD